MPKGVWFIVGFTVALLLITAFFVGAALRGGALVRATPLALTPTPEEIILPVATPAATPIASSRLQWLRQGELAGQCGRLEIDAAHQVRYGPCDEGTRLAYLTPEELTAYLTFVARYTPFDYAVQEPLNAWARATVRLHFEGRGQRPATIEEQAEVARWAASVFDRLMEEEKRSDLLAAARRELAWRKGFAMDAIQVVEISAVTWPDACLGLHAEGVFCAQVLTRGYRILLEAEGRTYEFRADERGTLRAVERFDPRFVLPPLPDGG